MGLRSSRYRTPRFSQLTTGCCRSMQREKYIYSLRCRSRNLSPGLVEIRHPNTFGASWTRSSAQYPYPKADKSGGHGCCHLYQTRCCGIYPIGCVPWSGTNLRIIEPTRVRDERNEESGATTTEGTRRQAAGEAVTVSPLAVHQFTELTHLLGVLRTRITAIFEVFVGHPFHFLSRVFGTLQECPP